MLHIRDADDADDSAPTPERAAAAMFGSFGNLFASGPKLNYDIERDFDARAFGVWRHSRGRSKVRCDATMRCDD